MSSPQDRIKTEESYMENTKLDRVLEIFFRGLCGEDLSVQRLADEYEVSTKSITRSINDLKNFLSDHRELVGHTELQYSYQDKCYRLYMDEFLSSKELFALVEVMIGARAFSKEELLALTSKLKSFTTPDDREKLNELIRKELYHYPEVKHDCGLLHLVCYMAVNIQSEGCASFFFLQLYTDQNRGTTLSCIPVINVIV